MNTNQAEPRVSVVIPVYNVAAYLRACVDSVLHQNYPQTEIILVDDGSDDASGAICDEYASADSRVSVIHQENHGLGHARNTGMRAASGTYIIFLDSDDLWRPDTLKTLLHAAEQHHLQAVVFAAEAFCDGVQHTGGPDYRHTAQNRIVKSGADSLAFAFAHGEYYAQACMRMYRLDYLRQHGFLFDEGIIHEDESFSFLAYLKAERVMCLGEQLYLRRYRQGSIMMQPDPFRSAHGYCTAAGTLLRYLQAHPADQQEKRLFFLQIRFCMQGIYRQYRAAQKDKQKIIEDTKDTIRQAYRSDVFPVHYRLLAMHFLSGYLYWRIRCASARMRSKLKRKNNA